MKVFEAVYTSSQHLANSLIMFWVSQSKLSLSIETSYGFTFVFVKDTVNTSLSTGIANKLMRYHMTACFEYALFLLLL